MQMEELLKAAASSMASASASASAEGSTSSALANFQWGGTIAALVLLLVNRVRKRSTIQTNLLVLYLFTSFPSSLFKILRGQFGCWISFLAIGANLFFPEIFPVARFILFVITPSWLANELRESIAGGSFCLVMGLLIVVEEIRVTVTRYHECNWSFFIFCIAMGFLFFYTTSYLSWGTWQ